MAHSGNRSTRSFARRQPFWHWFTPGRSPNSNMYRSLILTTGNWGMLPIRIGLGIIFFAHGAQKVFGIFGGAGFDRWLNQELPNAFNAFGPVKLWLAIAAFAELFGSIMVFIGFLTRVGAFLLGAVMLVAMIFVHWPYGFFLRDPGTDGVEYVLALLCCSIALMVEGGGRFSVDASS